MLGVVVMPHNLYLHSGLVLVRVLLLNVLVGNFHQVKHNLVKAGRTYWRKYFHAAIIVHEIRRWNVVSVATVFAKIFQMPLWSRN